MVDRIITDLAVLDITPGGLRLVAIAPGVTIAEVREKTDAPVTGERESLSI